MDATALHATRESALRVAQALVSKGQKADAIEILAAWASAANDQEGHKLLAEALRHDPSNALAKKAFACMEGLDKDTQQLDTIRAKWSIEAITKLEKEKKPAVGGWQAEVGYNNNVKYRGQVFHIQTEDSGVKRPHIITHLFADGGRILKSYKRSYAELVEQNSLVGQVRQWMKGQHKEMYIALREGKFDGIIDGKEPGGMEVLEGPPNPELPKNRVESPKVEAPKAEPPKAEVKPTSKPVIEPGAGTGSQSTPPRPPVSGAPRPAAVSPKARPESSPAVPAALPPLRARLHVIRGVGDGPMLHDLRNEEILLGRESAVVIAGDKFVAARHARLRFQGPHLTIEPLSGCPIFLRLKKPTEIELGDVFIAGDQLLRVEANPPPNDGPDQHPTYFYSSPKWPTTFRVVQIWEGGIPGMTVIARTNSLQVGRTNSDLNFPGDYWLSDAHCVIEDQGGEHDGNFLMLTDLGSRGGTFTQIKAATSLHTGDELLIGRTRLRVELTPPKVSLHSGDASSL